jgi:hypothetical protein
MKTFNEFKLLEAERLYTRTFNNVNDLADKEADKYAASMYSTEAEKMKSAPEVIDWSYCSSRGEEFKKYGEESWSRKNVSGGYSFIPGGNTQSVAGFIFTLKMKFPIKKKIEGFPVHVGDVPEYTFKLRLAFNTTGNAAYTSIINEKGESIIKLSDTSEMGIIVDKVKKMKPEQKDELHKMLYHAWVESHADKDHPLKGHIAGKQYGI